MNHDEQKQKSRIAATMKRLLLNVIQSLLHWLQPHNTLARSSSPEPLLAYPAEAEKDIVHAVRNGDASALDQTFGELRHKWAPYIQRPEMPFVCFQLALDALKEATRGADQEEKLREAWYRRIVEKLAMNETAATALDRTQQLCRELAQERAKLAEGKNKEMVEQVKQFIEETISDNMSVEQIAGQFHFSSAHLGKMFKGSTGSTLLEYITERKMRKSCALLEDTEITVSQIASQVGYTNVKSFSRVFKATHGVTPSEYRKNVAGKSLLGPHD
jgi:YesN/AraC family two-component response regulator